MTSQIAQAIDRLERADAEFDAVRQFIRDDPRPQATAQHRAMAQAQGKLAAALQDLRDAKEAV